MITSYGVSVFLQRESIANTGTTLSYAETSDQPQIVTGQRRSWASNFVRRLGDIVALDVRSLALLRVCLGLLILVNLAMIVLISIKPVLAKLSSK